MNSNVAFVFPGQGAQAVGMGRDMAERFPSARAVFEEADRELGFPLSELVWNGPAEELKQTYHTQPALLTTSVACWTALQAAGVAPSYVMGHSLGEYSALVAAGVLSFADAVRVVRKRAQLMNEAVPAGQGGMAAVIGFDRDELRRLCEEVSKIAGLVELANVNASSQIVISGTAEGVRAASAQAEARGAKRVLALEVSGPFHSSLMKPAADRFADVLAGVAFRAPRVPVISNVSAEPLVDPEAIRASLVRQIYSPVLWEDSVRWLLDRGVDTFYEIGPGAVLAGLIKKINRSAVVRSVHQPDALPQVEV